MVSFFIGVIKDLLITFFLIGGIIFSLGNTVNCWRFFLAGETIVLLGCLILTFSLTRLSFILGIWPKVYWDGSFSNSSSIIILFKLFIFFEDGFYPNGTDLFLYRKSSCAFDKVYLRLIGTLFSWLLINCSGWMVWVCIFFKPETWDNVFWLIKPSYCRSFLLITISVRSWPPI